MKNLKKIFSVILTMAMVCSLMISAFAADAGDPFETNYTVKAVASADSVEAGKDVTINVYIAFTDTPSEDIYFAEAGPSPWGVELSYDNSVFSYKSHSTTYALTETGNGGDKGTMFKYEAKMNGAITVSPNTAIFSVVFTANADLNEDALENIFTIESLSITDKSGNGADIGCDIGNYTNISATVDVTAGGEEVFEPTYEGVKAADGSVTEGFASGSKVATVFAKATGDLAAGTYGIVFGGQKYVGAADVKDGKYWVIRLYDPSGNILTGASYTCQKFVGDAYETVDYELENN